MRSEPAAETLSHTARAMAATVVACPNAVRLIVLDNQQAAAEMRHLLSAAAAVEARCCVIVCGSAAEMSWPDWATVHVEQDLATGLARLREQLLKASMGTRLYLSGSAQLIAQGSLIAAEAGMHRRSILTARFGPAQRRVQCVHCKTVNEGPDTAQRLSCTGCGTVLKPRAFFSERHQAFLGVADPGFLA